MGFNINTATPEELAELAGYLRPPVVTSYPTTEAAKAGQRFIYKGNEWHYMTQEEIDSTGWTDLIEVGFPAPVSKVFNRTILYSDSVEPTSMYTGSAPTTSYPLIEKVFDFLGIGRPNLIKRYNLGGFAIDSSRGYRIEEFLNVQLLINLEDQGTTFSLILIDNNLSAQSINKIFTDLPSTTKTATIDVRNNPGSATCDPSIATAKGYTVIT